MDLKINHLLFIIFLLFLASSGFAIVSASRCEILEKPENIDVSCVDNFLLIDDNVVDVKFLETPSGEIDETVYQNLVQEYAAMKGRISLDKYVAPLPSDSMDVPPESGIYVLRINDSYNLKVSYTSNQSHGMPFILAILVILVGIGALGGGIYLMLGNKRMLGVVMCILGIALILIFYPLLV